MSTMHHHRKGFWVSAASVAWTAAAASAEIYLGITHHVLSLLVFGAAGALDLVGSVSLALQFRHAIANDGIADHHEHRSTMVVSGGLLALGLVTLGESVRRLASGGSGSHTSAGIAIAAASVLVLAVLAVAKRRVARQTGSTALRVDAHLSSCGAVLAVVAVGGATIGTGDAWWVDPAAAAVIAAAAVYVGLDFIRRAGRLRSADRAEPT